MWCNILWWFWAAAGTWAPGWPWDHDGKQPIHLHSFCTHTIILFFSFCVYVLSHCSHVGLFATLWTEAQWAPLSMKFSGKNNRVVSHVLLQGIFLIQGLNPSLLCYLHLLASSLPWVPSGKPHFQFSSVQSLSNIQLFAIPWTAAHQFQYNTQWIAWDFQHFGIK